MAKDQLAESIKTKIERGHGDKGYSRRNRGRYTSQPNNYAEIHQTTLCKAAWKLEYKVHSRRYMNAERWKDTRKGNINGAQGKHEKSRGHQYDNSNKKETHTYGQRGKT